VDRSVASRRVDLPFTSGPDDTQILNRSSQAQHKFAGYVAVLTRLLYQRQRPSCQCAMNTLARM
jgi:hypothetical protein